MTWTCILITATNEARLSLRRYASESCPMRPYGMDIHDARMPISIALVVIDPERQTWDVDVAQPPRTDSRWPVQCACGYAFQDTDPWQRSKDRLYRREDTGALLTLHDVDSGMMWNAEWFTDVGWVGPDGQCLVMALPDGGQWTIDGPSRNGGGWTRTGNPPRITVRPSILSRGYHGFLNDGILSDDLEGRTYA